jgi:two-component system cell cycle sensor histidine kinase/response regulator CckA
MTPTPPTDFVSVLARLARSTVVENGDLGDVLRAIVEAAAVALAVERVNIWVLDRERTRLRCVEGYERGLNRHAAGDEIVAANAPAYFAAIAELRTVAAFDALTDPRTRELAGYLRPRNIATLLDAPLYLGGKVGGVVCHEHVGSPRRWTAEEQAFAGSVGDLVSLAMEADRRIRAERALREGEELFRAVGDRLHDAMLLVDVSDRHHPSVRYANEAACRLSGYGPDELAGQPLAVLGDAGTRAVADDQLGRALAGEIVLFDGVQRRKDGSVMPVEVYGRVIDCAGRPTLLLLGRDISRRVRAEQAQLEFQAKVLEAQRRESLGILAGSIAHEFSNLMMAILGGTGISLSQLGESSPARARMVQVEEAARRAADLCHQLQAYAGQTRLVMGPIALSALVDEVLQLMRTVVPRQVTVEKDLGRGLPAIEADAGQLRLVLVTLVSNAVEAIGDDPGTISVRTRAGRFTREDFGDVLGAWQAPDGEYVCLEVEDSGCGMSEETRRRMTEPFFTTKVVGRGLGLAAVHGIVRGHRGALAVTSQLGHGTTVRVFLPVGATPSERTDPKGVAARDERAGPGRPTILVVDDEPLVREVATVTLEGEGFVVLTARDAREARDLIDSRDEIAAVVLDLGLPDLPAEEILRTIRSQRPRLPVILSSGHHEQIATRGLDTDAAMFLQKPWQLSRLVALVKQALATR